jgi:tRNA A64-2'-O-ribosylphosphate transferase
VLCTASRRVDGAEASEGGYVQGAADDHEAWSHGLTPPMFWKSKDVLMSTNEENAPDVVAKLIAEESGNGTSPTATLIKPTSSLYITSSQHADLSDFDVVVSCTPEPFDIEVLKEAKIKHYLPLKCQTGKLGSRDLRNELPPLFDCFLNFSEPSTKILVCCPTGKDLSVGTALAILCLYTDDNGTIDLSTRRPTSAIDKSFIKQRLSWITTSNPTLNPSRSTLQSVNSVLLSSQDPKTTNLPIRTRTPVPLIRGPTAIKTQTTDQSDNGIPPQPPSVPSQIFTSLSSHPWSFHRTLTSALPTHPSGTVSGTATFTPCILPASFPLTLLYTEEGDFVTDTGLKFTARRKYVYQLIDDGIVVKFFDDEKLPRAKMEDGVGANAEGIGGLFVEMDTLTEGFEAKNKEQHLCAEDLYSVSWKFGKGMVGNEEGGDVWWEVRYDVKGPKKDYVSRTRYEKK